MERELPSQVEESPVSNRRIHYKRHWKAIGNTGLISPGRMISLFQEAARINGYSPPGTITGERNMMVPGGDRLPLARIEK